MCELAAAGVWVVRVLRRGVRAGLRVGRAVSEQSARDRARGAVLARLAGSIFTDDELGELADELAATFLDALQIDDESLADMRRYLHLGRQVAEMLDAEQRPAATQAQADDPDELARRAGWTQVGWYHPERGLLLPAWGPAPGYVAMYARPAPPDSRLRAHRAEPGAASSTDTRDGRQM